MGVRRFENRRWQNKEQGFTFKHKAALELIKKGPVLDLGCGDGLFLLLLKKTGISGKGLDISDIAVEKARAKGLDVKWFDFSAKALPFSDNSFENVVLLDVLEHLYLPLNVLQEASRVSKRYVVFSVPNFNSFPARLQMMLGKVPENNKHRQGHIYWFSYKVVKDLLEESNLKIEEMNVNSFFCRVPVLKKIMHLLAKKRPSIFALTFVVKATEKKHSV